MNMQNPVKEQNNQLATFWQLYHFVKKILSKITR